MYLALLWRVFDGFMPHEMKAFLHDATGASRILKSTAFTNLPALSTFEEAHVSGPVVVIRSTTKNGGWKRGGPNMVSTLS